MSADPVFYYHPEGLFEDPDMAGVSGEGWYFWDETWSQSYGPYETEEEAREACVLYAEQL